MIEKHRMREVAAIVVARECSQRLPNKNLLPLGGVPLFLRKIRQLKEATYVDRVVFGSDSEVMLDMAQAEGCEIIERPKYFCDEGECTANEMIFNMCESIKTDIVVWAHCTNPLISASTYDKAIDIFITNLPKYDSLISVVPLREHLWRRIGIEYEPMNYNPWSARHTPARELEPYMMQDGGIFIQHWEQMKTNRYFFGRKPFLFKIPSEEFLDINTERDYLLAKAIIERGTN